MNYLILLLIIFLIVFSINFSLNSNIAFHEEYLEYDKFYIIRLHADTSYMLSSEGCSSISDSLIKTFVLLDYIWYPNIVKFGNTKMNKHNENYYLFKFEKRNGETYQDSYVRYNDKFDITHYCNSGHLIQKDQTSDLYIQFNTLLPNYLYQWWCICDTEDCSNTTNKRPVKTGEKFFLTLQRESFLLDKPKIQYEVLIQSSDKKYKNKQEPSTISKILGEDFYQTLKLGFFIILFFLILPYFIYFYRIFLSKK